MRKSPTPPPLYSFARSVVTLPRSTKKFIMWATDFLALPGCLVAAVWLVTPGSLLRLPPWLWLIPLVVGVPALRYCGFYRSVIRFMGLDLVAAALKSVSIVALVVLLVVTALDNGPDAVRASAAFWLLGMVYIVGSRIAVRWLLQSRNAAGDRVIIYGAGEAGANLASELIGRGDFVPVAFVDDNPALRGVVMNGLEVHPPASLAGLRRRIRRDPRAARSAVGVAPHDAWKSSTSSSSFPCTCKRCQTPWTSCRVMHTWRTFARWTSRICSAVTPCRRYRGCSTRASARSPSW